MDCLILRTETFIIYTVIFMKKIISILFLTALPHLVWACTTCNRELQNGISASFNLRNVGSIGMTLLFIILITLGISNFVLKNHLKRLQNGGVPSLSPAPVLSASIVLGIGLGGFIDGIVFHQLLQWHQLLSNEITTNTVEGKSINMFWDGLFHVICLVAVCIGISLLWKALLQTAASHSAKLVWSGLLSGWGIFNVIEGIIDHHVFKIHNVRETMGNHEFFNLSFLVYSIMLLIAGWLLYRSEMTKNNINKLHTV